MPARIRAELRAPPIGMPSSDGCAEERWRGARHLLVRASRLHLPEAACQPFDAPGGPGGLLGPLAGWRAPHGPIHRPARRERRATRPRPAFDELSCTPARALSGRAIRGANDGEAVGKGPRTGAAFKRDVYGTPRKGSAWAIAAKRIRAGHSAAQPYTCRTRIARIRMRAHNLEPSPRFTSAARTRGPTSGVVNLAREMSTSH